MTAPGAVRRTAVLTTLSILLATAGAAALTDEERNDRYAACFDFRSLVRGGTVRPAWIDGGRSFWYTAGEPDSTVIHRVDSASGEREPIFDTPRLRAALAAALAGTTEVAVPGHGVPFAVFELDVETNSAAFTCLERDWRLDLDSYRLTEETAPEPATSARAATEEPGVPSPDGSWIATVRDGALHLDDSAGEVSHRLTEADDDDRMWTTYGASWSPDGRTLAVLAYDLTGVHRIPLVDWLAPDEPVIEDPYPRCDGPRAVPDLHLVDAETRQMRRVEAGGDEDDLLPAGWREKTGELLVLRFNRTMDEQDLLAIDPPTGQVRAIVSERSETFIDGLAAAFLTPHYHHPTGDGEHFLWLSQRDGWHHLYLYRYDGTLVRQVTRGRFPVTRVEAVDLQGEWIYFTAQSDPASPYDRHLCRVRFSGRDFAQLTIGTGRHVTHISPDFGCFVDNHSDADRPPVAELCRIDGTPVAILETADLSGLAALDWRPPERAVVKAADGRTDLHAILYFPPDFDPAHRYAVIEMIYAGPQWPIVPRRFIAGEYGDTALALAQLGYVTVIIDGRGTAGLSKEFQDEVFGRLGQVEIPDHVAALRNLAADRPWLDLSRVGVHGKSWGGYFTLRAMLQAPDFYKVGVCSAPVADLRTTAESPVVPYLGLPADNPAGYDAADCLRLADRLQGDLLITIGTADGNTPFGESMRMLRAFNEADKDVEVLVLPGEHHWLQEKSFVRWQRAMRDFFREKLPPTG